MKASRRHMLAAKAGGIVTAAAEGQAHLRIDRQTIDALRKEKKPIVPA